MVQFKHYEQRNVERATGYTPRQSELEIDTELFLADLNGEESSVAKAREVVHGAYIELRATERRLRTNTDRKTV